MRIPQPETTPVERRHFLRTGVAASLLGAGLPASLEAVTRPRRGLGTAADPIKLSSNENPLGLSPWAEKAIIEGLVEANRYPGATGQKVIAALARYHGVHEDNIVTGFGSTEILRLAVHGIGLPDGRLVAAEPTFEDAPGYSEPVGIPIDKIPLRADASHDIPRMRDAVARSDGRVVVFLCNPNNPTGTLTSCAEIDAWITEAPDNVFFILDEAYFDFVEDSSYWTGIKWIADNPNVLVSRTFSKVYGMAGMRLGYGMAHPETVKRLFTVATRNNVNHLAGVAALASLNDKAYYAKSVATNKRGRDILYAALRDLDIAYLPSHTNFVMHRIRGSLTAYNDRMLEHGFRVGRQFPPMTDHSRISVGMPQDMERFADTLQTFRTKGWI
jgi:histidinol-phosphate aminotransferase